MSHGKHYHSNDQKTRCGDSLDQHATLCDMSSGTSLHEFMLECIRPKLVQLYSEKTMLTICHDQNRGSPSKNNQNYIKFACCAQ